MSLRNSLVSKINCIASVLAAKKKKDVIRFTWSLRKHHYCRLMVRMGPCLSSYTCYSLLTNYGHAFRQHKVVLLFTAVLSFSTEHRASAPPPYAGSYQQYTPPAAGPAYPDTAPPQYDNQQPYGVNSHLVQNVNITPIFT